MFFCLYFLTFPWQNFLKKKQNFREIPGTTVGTPGHGNRGLVALLDLLDPFGLSTGIHNIWQKDIDHLGIFQLHPRKLTCSLKRDYFSRECIFQPLIFRGHVSFQGGKLGVSFAKKNLPSLCWTLFSEKKCLESSRSTRICFIYAISDLCQLFMNWGSWKKWHQPKLHARFLSDKNPSKWPTPRASSLMAKTSVTPRSTPLVSPGIATLVMAPRAATNRWFHPGRLVLCQVSRKCHHGMLLSSLLLQLFALNYTRCQDLHTKNTENDGTKLLV